MASRSFFDQPALPRLPQLLDEVRTGQILIPKFQRPFEWEDKRRVLLLDSIAKGVPIGSLLVWQTKTHALKTFDKIGAFRIVSPELPSSRTYLIDGHQRLTTLFAAFSTSPGASSDPEEDVIRPIYVDLVSEDPAFLFVIPGRGNKPPPPTLVHVGDLLDSRKLFDAQGRLYKAGSDIEARKLEEVSNAFKDYQIPVVPLITEDINIATDAFVRINSGGKPMSSSYMVQALAYARFPMRDRTDTMIEDLADVGWAKLRQSTMLKLLKIRWGLNAYDTSPSTIVEEFENEKRGSEDDKRAFSRVFEEVETSLRGAIEFLRSVAVHGPAVLPYEYQLVVLADVDRRVRGLSNLDPEAQDKLRRWFWSTTFGEYFGGKTSNKIREAVDHLEAIANGEPEVNPADLKLDYLPLTKHHFKAARVRGRALKLVTRLSDVAERTLRADQLGQLGPEAMLSLDRQLDGRRAGARIVGDIDTRRRVRYAIQNTSHDPNLLEEHIVSTAAAEFFKNEEWNDFMSERENDIVSWEADIVSDIGLRPIMSVEQDD